ncbi:type II secretion system F family protein [Acinetobacter bereziniae]|uniref:type II secretion system F family protein n=1 Tax=Acinetobacter bereziniae TaxID=106648 RepID=UPI0012506E51|nr:type II secretion system F family protein [Acinetobacter bereziniae]
MAIFNVKYLDSTGKIITAKIEASNIDGIFEQNDDKFLIDVKEINNNKFLKRNKKFNYLVFAYELKTLIKSGLSISEALNILKDNNSSNREILENLYTEIYGGLSFSNAMRKSKEQFPNLFIATIAASEKNGTMIDAFDNYIAYEENINKLKDKIITATTYPLILVFVSILIVLFLLLYLVPKFSLIYQDVTFEVPFLSKILLQFGGYIYEYQYLVIGVIILNITILLYTIKKLGFEKIFVSFLEKNRFTQGISTKFILSRFYKGFVLLLFSGCTAFDSLELMKTSLTEKYRSKIDNVKKSLLNGESLSKSLIAEGLTTVVSERLLIAGDKNGEVVNMLKQSAEFYDMEIERFIERLSQILEPMLMILIGFFIGGIVLLLYMPIFDLANSIQQ